jgi:hypothetical protein
LKNAEFIEIKKRSFMKINLKWQIAMVSTLAPLLVAVGVSAQSNSDARANAEALAKTLTQTIQANGGGGGSVGFTTSIVGTYSRPVTNAPYSAQIVTESVQPFPDGNSISHTSTSTVYRDAQGRTRREQNINIVGPSQVSGSPIQFITIDDPVSGVRYTLNPNKMTATQFATSGTAGSLPVKVVPNPDGSAVMTYSISGDGLAGGGGGRGGSISVMMPEVSADNVATESLGADTMQGLSVLGTRVTRTIPAGQIGNAQPILIITDKWYSQDLQIEVKTVHSDPRTGTTTTTVTNLSRNEPNPSLFTVPPGYTISTGGRGGNQITFKPQDPL